MKGALYNLALCFESLSKTANEVETLSNMRSIFEAYRDVYAKYKQKFDEQ